MFIVCGGTNALYAQSKSEQEAQKDTVTRMPAKAERHRVMPVPHGKERKDPLHQLYEINDTTIQNRDINDLNTDSIAKASKAKADSVMQRNKVKVDTIATKATNEEKDTAKVVGKHKVSATHAVPDSLLQKDDIPQKVKSDGDKDSGTTSSEEADNEETPYMTPDEIALWTDSIERAHKMRLDTATVAKNIDDISKKAAKSLEKLNFVPDPNRSLWLGLVFPGAGQVYNHKYWKIPIFYGGFLGCTYALTWNNQMLRDYSQAYLDIMDDDPNTKSYMDMLPMGYDISGREDRFKEIFKNKKNYYRKYRDMSIFAFAGVYLLSVIDAYVDAELSTFDVSRDLSMHIEPTSLKDQGKMSSRFEMSGMGLMCRINF